MKASLASATSVIALLVFVVYPIVELLVAIWIAQYIGWIWVILLTCIGFVAGLTMTVVVLLAVRSLRRALSESPVRQAEQMRQLEADQATLKQSQSKLADEKAALERDLQSARKKVVALDGAVRAKLDQSERDLEQARKELSDTRAQLARTEHEAAERIAGLEQRLAETEARAGGLAAHLTEREQQVNTCSARNQQMAQAGRAGPALATAGTGDVLAGTILALLAQGLAPFEAATVGAYVHGLAGCLAAEEIGRSGVIASDVVEQLPLAWRKLAEN